MFGGPQAIMFINILPNLYLAEWQADRRPSVIAFLSLLFSFKLISNDLNKCIYWFWIHCKIIYLDSWFMIDDANPSKSLMLASMRNKNDSSRGASKRRSPLISIHEVWKKYINARNLDIGEFSFGGNIMYNIEQQPWGLWLEKML